jgi:hypothetical protein
MTKRKLGVKFASAFLLRGKRMGKRMGKGFNYSRKKGIGKFDL